MQIGERFYPQFLPSQGNAYMGNGVRDLRNYTSWHHRHFAVGFIDWTSIILAQLVTTSIIFIFFS